MKKGFFILFSIFIFNANGQSNFQTEIKLIETETNKQVLTVEVKGYGDNQIKAENSSMKNLFFALLFRGIAGSPSIEPLLGVNENLYLSKYKAYFNEFFDNKRYTTFINQKTCGEIRKVNRTKFLTCKLSINIQNIISDLKTNNLIQNYGF